ncbi:MAG: hypothetical protein ACYC5G_00005, partial [Candidatus Doudnabacteria bacterium]
IGFARMKAEGKYIKRGIKNKTKNCPAALCRSGETNVDIKPARKKRERSIIKVFGCDFKKSRKAFDVLFLKIQITKETKNRATNSSRKLLGIPKIGKRIT